MNDIKFEAKIVAASPRGDKTNSFVKETMKQIKRSRPKPARGFAHWFNILHKPAVTLGAFVGVVIVAGGAYAAIQFAPALVQLLNKETNSRGATEYSVQGFKDCTNPMSGPALNRIEVKKGVNLSDEEVQKIVQAKCEIAWLQEFPGHKWPTYGTNAEWKDGDTIYYTRIDMLGKYQEGDATYANIALGDRSTRFTPPQDEKIRAFAGGEEIALSEIKPGDTVFTITRVSEIYYDMRNVDRNDPKLLRHGQPQTIGLVALFKMSLPYEYYMEKQNLITEIPECFGNEGELCPSTAGVDIYPRAGGEGATNPYLRNYKEGDVTRQISGTVTELSADTLTLKSRSGRLYTVTVGDAGFKEYNDVYTKPYDMDVTLRVGSTVQVMYMQAKEDDPTKISKDQVRTVGLHLEASKKGGEIKQY